LGERQWGTVREDYSPNGEAWTFFPFTHARSRAYRWGEDGLAGFCDEAMRWCLGLALWNGKDAILKERLFGVSGKEGNHGEDVKEVYHFVDATPTHSYQKMVYRYPHDPFPYDLLVSTNKQRSRQEPEFELDDTGVLNGRRFFDVTVEYAKADPEDILMSISIENAAEAAAVLHVLPQLWARNTWSWRGDMDRPRLRITDTSDTLAFQKGKRTRRLSVGHSATLLFCENETNLPLLFDVEAPGPFKDGINDFIVAGRRNAISATGEGSKVAAHVRLELPAGARTSLRLRWRPDGEALEPFANFDAILVARPDEADEFYAAIQADIADPDARAIQRQALAGLLWTKQAYFFDIPAWLAGDPAQPTPPPERRRGRNADWLNLKNADVISMPDTWEYPWYASWDLGFHTVSLALIDPGLREGATRSAHTRVVHASQWPDARL
jgi:hypothetical protein